MMIDSDLILYTLLMLMAFTIIKAIIEEYYHRKRVNHNCCKCLTEIKRACWDYGVRIEDLPDELRRLKELKSDVE